MSGVLIHIFNSKIQKQRQADFYGFKANQVYIVSPQIASATWSDRSQERRKKDKTDKKMLLHMNLFYFYFEKHLYYQNRHINCIENKHVFVRTFQKHTTVILVTCEIWCELPTMNSCVFVVDCTEGFSSHFMLCQYYCSPCNASIPDKK